MDKTVWWWNHHCMTESFIYCPHDAHLLHHILLFLKGALYLKLGALSSWSLMRAVTVLHKHCLSPLWTSGFDRLWWAVTRLKRLSYFKLLDRRRPKGWSLPIYFSCTAGRVSRRSILIQYMYSCATCLSASIVKINLVIFKALDCLNLLRMSALSVNAGK